MAPRVHFRLRERSTFSYVPNLRLAWDGTYLRVGCWLLPLAPPEPAAEDREVTDEKPTKDLRRNQHEH